MSRCKLHKRHNRRGLAVSEWFCILGLLGVALFVLGGRLGDSIQADLSPTAQGIANPTDLLNHPRFHGQSQTQSRPKGNNGVGNGEDPQPPGNPPINDGPGTGPGNPGNRGGAKR